MQSLSLWSSMERLARARSQLSGPLCSHFSRLQTGFRPLPALVVVLLDCLPLLGSNNTTQHTLLIGDSITRNIRLATPATVCCLPRARASNIEANLRVLTSRREKQGSPAHSTTTSFSNIVVHVGTNNVCMKQPEITKESFSWTLELARKMNRHRLIISGPLPAWGNDEMYSRLTSLNRWLAC